VFYGIIIRIYYRDHPPAHFHAIYREHEALVEIEAGRIYRGELPRTAGEFVNQWRELHVDELLEDWNRARDFQPILPISQLE
jgi:Domain of unknown function (DUF4160)